MPKNVEKYLREKAELQDRIVHMQTDLEQLKTRRKAVDRHITIGQLPEEVRFRRLSTQAKHFVDTIKMIAYRAETAMSHVVREHMTREEDARNLLRAIFNAEAYLLPNEEEGILKIRIHHLATHCNDETLRHLCVELNKTETKFPGTNLSLVYDLVSSQNHRDQDVCVSGGENLKGSTVYCD